MDEFENPLTGQDAGKVPEVQLVLGTVTYASSSDGIRFIPDGAEETTAKKYKCVQSGRVIRGAAAGGRCVALKTSGSYIILGNLGNPPPQSRPQKLPTGASLAAVVSKVNDLIEILRNAGIIITTTDP